MKKSLIAGAGVAAFAFAALPFVGVFAVSPVTVTDNLTLNVTETCGFSAGGTGLNLSDTVGAGEATTFNSSNHAFTVNCNSDSYTVTAASTNLTKTGAVGTHGTINYVTNAAYTAAAAASPIAADGVWTAVLTDGDTDAAISTTSSTIKSGHSTTTDTFSVAYKALAGSSQEQGAYTGTVTYTLTGTSATNSGN